MALQLDPNSGLPLDPATLQAIQEQNLMQSLNQQGGGAAYRLNAEAVGRGVNTLFPSPEMQQAKTAQQALGAAQLTQDDGESDMDFSVRQMRSNVAALAKVDPRAALSAQTQLLKLEEMQSQQAHLKAADQRADQQEADRHQDEELKQTTGSYMHLMGADGKTPIGSYNVLDTSAGGGLDAYKKARAANPGSIGMTDKELADWKIKMDEQKQAIDEKARFQLGGADGFGNPKVEALLASLASKGVNLPAGFRSSKQMLAMFQGLLTKYDGLTTDDIADIVGKGNIDFNAVKKATGTAATILGRVTTATGEMDAMVPIARDASAAVPRSDFVPFNKLQQMVRAGTSSPEQKRLYVATLSIMNQFDMLASRGGTDKDKRAALHKALDTADGPEAYNAALDMMVTEGKVAKAGALGAIRAGTYGLDEQKAAIAAGVPAPAATPTAPPAAPAAAPSNGLPAGWSVTAH